MRNVEVYRINCREAIYLAGRKTDDDSFPKKGQKIRHYTFVDPKNKFSLRT